MRNHDPEQWDRFAHLYTPLVYQWCQRAGVAPHDTPDVVQEVFRVVATKISSFRRDREGDTFQGWLWGITRNKVKDHFRKRQNQPDAAGGTTAHDLIHGVAEELPDSWNDEQQNADVQLVYQRSLELLQTDFEPRTWQAFWRVVVESQAPAAVAADLGMSVGAIYNAKYKVIRRLREEFADLITD